MNKQKTQRRRAPSKTEVQMLDLHESPVYGVDLSQDTRLHELHTRLVRIEDRIRLIVGLPLSVVRIAKNQIKIVVREALPPAVRKKVEEALRGELGSKRRLRRVS